MHLLITSTYSPSKVSYWEQGHDVGLKVADESNLPGFFAVTIITSVIFLLLFFKLNPLSNDQLAVDRQLLTQFQIPRRYECECDWIRLVFSLALCDHRDEHQLFPALPRCLIIEGSDQSLRRPPPSTRLSKKPLLSLCTNELCIEGSWQKVSSVFKITRNSHSAAASGFSDVQVSDAALH